VTNATPIGNRATDLRNRTVDELIEAGTIVSRRVEEVMRKVPRETFAPEAGLEAVYEPWNGLVTKKDAGGRSLSSLSAPDAQAHMLEQARIEPGMNVLEIGSGGVNAAYLSEMVGPKGRVTTVDIDEFVTERSSRFLKAAGYSRVNVVLADAENGVPEYAPYDRILVTVGAWDIPPAWIEQLTDGGLLVVPLKVQGLMRTVALVRDGDRLVSESARMFGFVPMQGAGAHDSTELILGNGVTLVFDERPPSGSDQLEHVLDFAPQVIESGAGLLQGEPWATMQMWLATTVPGFCRIQTDREANANAPRPLGGGYTGMAAIDGANLAYVATRELGGTELALDVHAYGPNPNALAGNVADQLRIWDRDHRGGKGPQYLIYPMSTPDDQLPPADFVMDKRHCRVLISWPRPTGSVGRDNLHHPNHL